MGVRVFSLSLYLCVWVRCAELFLCPSAVHCVPPAVPIAFPTDILESDSPNIYVTSPQNPAPAPSHFPSLSSLPTSSLHQLHSISPSSSPTTADFPSHAHAHPHSHTPHTLSRQHSYQHIPYDGGLHHAHAHSHTHHTHHQPPHHQPQHHHHSHHGMHPARYDSAMGTPLPPSPGPGPMDYDERGGSKRQRPNPSTPALAIPGGADGSAAAAAASGVTGKKGSRARSDSAPLGYGLSSWQTGRPRSGSGYAGPAQTRGSAFVGVGVGGVGGVGVGVNGAGMNGAGAGMNGRREEVPNIGSLSRSQLPMLSIPSMTKQSS